MKANELMIGDWVRSTLLNKMYKMNTTSMRKMCWNEDNGMIQDVIEPIPITEEILKVNKIHYQLPKNNETFDKEWVIPNGAFHIRQDGHIFWVFEDQVPILYVHELQHALRLSKLNEIADNFKIGYE